MNEEMQLKLAEAHKNITKLADKLILEYMQKKGLTIEDLQGNVFMQNYPYGLNGDNNVTLAYWYKDELILSVKQKFDLTQPTITRCEMVIEKGKW